MRLISNEVLKKYSLIDFLESVDDFSKFQYGSDFLLTHINELTPECMVKFLDKNFDINEETSDRATFPLLCACAEFNYDLAYFLIEKGADVNQINIFGYTPLMIAIRNNEPELVKCLLNKGAWKTINQFNNEKQNCWTLLEKKYIKDRKQIKSIIQDFQLKQNFKTIDKRKNKIL